MMQRFHAQRSPIPHVLIAAAALLFGVLAAGPACAGEPPKNSPPPGFEQLFNGEDLTGWEGLVADPEKRRAMNPQQRVEAQAKANQRMKKHWTVEDGVLVYDGNGKSLATARDFGDFEMLVDWKIKDNGDSGLYLRGSPQVQIWDPAHHEGTGSGGLFNNKQHLSKPIRTADHPIGEWNTFRVRMFGDRVWVWLNDELVTPGVVMENYWDRDKRIYRTEQIELQHHGNTLRFKNIYIKELWPEDRATATLFDGSGLESFRYKKGGWHINGKGELTNKPDDSGYIWTKQPYDDFVLDLEYKISEGGNSGIFFRTDPSNAVHGGFEIQILDSADKDKLGQKDGGALYDAAAPTKNTLKPAGEWNRVKLICEGPHITVITNGEKTLQVNIDRWDTAKQNPDGTKNKFKNPLGELPKTGHIGFQDHGDKVWFRNVEITPLPIE